MPENQLLVEDSDRDISSDTDTTESQAGNMSDRRPAETRSLAERRNVPLLKLNIRPILDASSSGEINREGSSNGINRRPEERERLAERHDAPSLKLNTGPIWDDLQPEDRPRGPPPSPCSAGGAMDQFKNPREKPPSPEDPKYKPSSGTMGSDAQVGHTDSSEETSSLAERRNVPLPKLNIRPTLDASSSGAIWDDLQPEDRPRGPPPSPCSAGGAMDQFKNPREKPPSPEDPKYKPSSGTMGSDAQVGHTDSSEETSSLADGQEGDLTAVGDDHLADVNSSDTTGSPPNDQSMDDQRMDNESTNNESTDNESIVNESTVNESIVNESTDSESTVSYLCIFYIVRDQQSTDSESTDSESTDSESTDSESTDSESTDSESIVNESTVNVSIVNESTVNVSIVNESTGNESPDNSITDDSIGEHEIMSFFPSSTITHVQISSVSNLKDSTGR